MCDDWRGGLCWGGLCCWLCGAGAGCAAGGGPFGAGWACATPAAAIEAAATVISKRIPLSFPLISSTSCMERAEPEFAPVVRQDGPSLRGTARHPWAPLVWGHNGPTHVDCLRGGCRHYYCQAVSCQWQSRTYLRAPPFRKIAQEEGAARTVSGPFPQPGDPGVGPCSASVQYLNTAHRKKFQLLPVSKARVAGVMLPARSI